MVGAGLMQVYLMHTTEKLVFKGLDDDTTS